MKSVDQNAFTIDRNLRDYQQILGHAFLEFLESLGTRHHWIDAGAGKALAIQDYLESDLFLQKAKCTAISVVKPEYITQSNLETKFSSLGFRYLDGRHIEEMPVEQIGFTDLITDIYGPVQYSERIDLLFGHYMTILKPGGRLWTVMPASTFIVDDKNKEIELRDWLVDIQGWTPIQLPDRDSPTREVVMVRNQANIKVPELSIKSIHSGPPPMRTYVLQRS